MKFKEFDTLLAQLPAEDYRVTVTMKADLNLLETYWKKVEKLKQ